MAEAAGLLLLPALGIAPLIGDRGLEALEPQAPPGLSLSADSCVECHARVVEQWRGSRHAVAGTNAVFWEAWTRWPNGWCVHCHAPLAEGQRQTLGGVVRPGAFPTPAAPAGLWTEGVNCATCHLRDGAVLSARAPTDAAVAAHPVQVEPALGTAAACAGCHDFPFQHHGPPGTPFALGEEPAQATVREWALSTAARDGIGCQDCHMDQHGHRFPGGHDRALVRAAVQVEVARAGPRALLTVQAPGVAHRVPTGDPFRRLVVELCADEGCAEVVARQSLRRVYAVTDTSWRLVADRTIPPARPGAPAARVVELPAAGASWWRLSYRFADPDHEASLPAEEVGYTITAGPLPPE